MSTTEIYDRNLYVLDVPTLCPHLPVYTYFVCPKPTCIAFGESTLLVFAIQCHIAISGHFYGLNHRVVRGAANT